jgi:type VI secretion system protein ImpA
MNNKTQTTTKPRKPAVLAHDWLAPLNDATPCGIDLEYDADYVVLFAKITIQPDAQYGHFVGSPEPLNWNEIERDCRKLMMQSKDIRLATLFTRCRTRLAGAPGCAEGLSLLANWLERYPDDIHPQLAVDSDRNAALEIRANTLQALTDTEGLLSDLREIALVTSMATRLTVRDVERAFTLPRPTDALAQISVTHQLETLREQKPALVAGFDQAQQSLGALENWCKQQLGSYAPDLSVLAKLLNLIARPLDERSKKEAVPNATVFPAPDITETQASPSPADPATAPSITETETPTCATIPAPADRQAALEMMGQARLWFEIHEPSSPIPVLLKRAEKFVGKRYAEIAQAIPTDLLAQWDSET